jgi:hypothetical protein
MPTSYEFKGDLIFVTAMEDVTLHEVFETVVKAINEPLFRRGMGCLIHDFKSSIIFDFDHPKECVDFQESIRNKISSVALVVYKEFNYGLGRMISVICKNHGLKHQVFYSFEKAKMWLEENSKKNVKELVTN